MRQYRLVRPTTLLNKVELDELRAKVLRVRDSGEHCLEDVRTTEGEAILEKVNELSELSELLENDAALTRLQVIDLIGLLEEETDDSLIIIRNKLEQYIG